MRNRTALLTVSICLLTTVLASGKPNQRDAPQVVHVEGAVEYTHDPSIAKDGDTWYLFGTANGPVRDGELPPRCPKYLRGGKRGGNFLEKFPVCTRKESPAT